MNVMCLLEVDKLLMSNGAQILFTYRTFYSTYVLQENPLTFIHKFFQPMKPGFKNLSRAQVVFALTVRQIKIIIRIISKIVHAAKSVAR